MKFTFTRVAETGSQPLPIIPEIPDIRLAQLEGRNGIGKTLAARLLELISGEQPFAALPKAWASLVRLLGTVEVRIEGAPEGPIDISLDSAEWTDRSQADCAANPGTVTIAGNPATWDAVRRIFQVRRIAGDEGLAETLGRTLREQSIAAEEEATRLIPLVATWSDELDALRDVTAVASPAELQALRTADRDAAAAVKRAQTAARKAAEEAALIADRWVKATQALEAVRTIPGLLDAYGTHLVRHEAARFRTSQLEGDLARAGAARVHNAQTQKEIGVWTRRLDLRRTALTRARLQERQLLTFLGLEGEPSEATLRELQTATAEALKDLKARLRTVDMASTVRNVGTDIEASLETIPASGRDEAIAELDRPVSAAELLAGIRVRRDALRDVPRPGEAVDLERQISKLEARSRRLRELPEYLDTTERKLSNVRDAEGRLATLLALTADQRSAREGVEKELADSREVLVSASSEAVRTLADIQALGAVGSAGEELGRDTAQDMLESTADESAENDDAAFEAAEEALESAVRRILRPVDEVTAEVATWFDSLIADIPAPSSTRSLHWGDHGTNESALTSIVAHFHQETASADERLNEAASRLDEIEHDRESTRNALRSERLALAAAITTLLAPNGRWTRFAPAVRRAVTAAQLTDSSLALTTEGFIGGTATDQEQAAIEVAVSTALQAIGQVAEEIEEAASKWRDGWGTVSAYMRRETRRLAPRLADDGAWSLGGLDPAAEAVLQGWTEHAIGSILSSEALRSQLFDGTEEVAFDLVDLAVSWRDKDDRRRRRPLEAFSSGEQVFAYTRAKLETFRSLRSTTRFVVIFLDEFGAFVARDRFSELLRYVHEEALGTIADQVVVMLPLSANDVEQALASRSLRAGREEGSVVRDNYFVVSAEPERVR